MRGLVGSRSSPGIIPRSVLAGLPLGALTAFVPLDLVLRVVHETRTTFKRDRSLPSPLVVYFVLALCLFRNDPSLEVLRKLLEPLRMLLPHRHLFLPSQSALSKARIALGVAPMRRLFECLAIPIANEFSRGAYFRTWRTVVIDGSCLPVYDSPDNVQAFGYPSSSRGQSAFPQLRLLTLIESGTHAPIALTFGPFCCSEQELALPVFHKLSSDMLCLADRNFFSFSSWRLATANGAQLLWRVRKNLRLEALTFLDDGSYLSRIYPNQAARKRDDGITVRVIEYQMDNVPDAEPSYRLLTTVLDPKLAPAQALAELYQERWEVESALDEIKTHLRGNWLLLRSKIPKLVEQELYALFLTHYALRSLMHRAALEGDIDPDTLSFTHTVRVVRRTLPRVAAFSPSDLQSLPDPADAGNT